MRDTTASALVSQYRPPRASAPESPGPCLVEGCGGTLEVRHERMIGKVYVACPECERRVRLVERLRAQLAAVTADRERLLERLRAPSPEAPRAKGINKARVYRERPCARDGCGIRFMPTGPNAKYCHDHTAQRGVTA